ncbi:MAG TPA: gamma-glutamyltransferase, partial [Bryobacteraceae bacterium]|nr:gamma-glutamyltransferase [Bryobacteraceae bacterium]
TADFFRNRPLQPGEVQVLEPGGLRGIIPVAGLMPVLVPGMVDAGLVALRETGTVSAADALQPALELADGLIVDEMRAGVIGWSKRFLDLWPGTKSIFMPGERPPVPGEILRQPDLARTIRTMIAAERKALTAGASRQAAIDAVRDVFYRGEIARRIAAFVGANGGLLTYEDMASFRSKPEPAVCGEYRGYAVCKPGFWTQGPVTLQALNILEGFDLRTMGHNSAGYLHTVAEAIKLALADRDTFYADPTVVKVPAERLLSKSYAADRRKLIGPKASHDFRPGSGGTHPSLAETQMVRIDDDLKMRDTTGITASDATGTVFAATPSGAALPTVVAGDTGVPLTQRAQSFFLIPGHPNELAGGKRPRITLSPTLVTRNGKPWLLLSTPGGDNQDQALLQVLLNVAEFGMNMQNAIEAPRFQTRHLVASFDNHAMRRGDLLLDERVAPSVYADLTERGHKTATRSRWNSGAHPVGIRILTNGVMEAGVDPWGYRVAHGW